MSQRTIQLLGNGCNGHKTREVQKGPWKLMLIEKEWGKNSKPLYLVRCRNRTAWRKRENLSRQNRWLPKSATQTRKLRCSTTTHKLPVTFSLDRYCFCAHCANRGCDKSHPSETQLTVRDYSENGYNDRNPSGVGSKMETELFLSWNPGTLIH